MIVDSLNIGTISFGKNQSSLKECIDRTIEEIVIPNNVTKIGSLAFESCTSLTSVTIPNSVTSINAYAFGHCSSLSSITIANSVTDIHSYAFRFCSSLTNITYQGTKEEWNAINKELNWNLDAPITVIHCTDGDISL